MATAVEVLARPVADWASATERQIRAGLALGDAGAFGELFRRYAGRLRNYLNRRNGLQGSPVRCQVDDLVTDTLVDIRSFAERHWHTVPDTTDPLRTLIHTFGDLRARRQVMLYWREAPTHADVDLENLVSVDTPAEAADFLERSEQKQRQVADLLDMLTPQQRQVMKLRYLERMSHAQAAAQLGIAVSRSQRLVRQAMRRLRGPCRLSGCDRRAQERGLCVRHRSCRDSSPRLSVGERNPNARLDPRRVVAIRQAHRAGTSIAVLAVRYGIGYTTVWKVVHGVTWRHVTNDGQSSDVAALRVNHHGEANPRAKLTVAQVREIRRTYAAGGCTMKQLAGRFNVTTSAVTGVVTRRTWRHVEDGTDA